MIVQMECPMWMYNPRWMSFQAQKSAPVLIHVSQGLSYRLKRLGRL